MPNIRRANARHLELVSAQIILFGGAFRRAPSGVISELPGALRSLARGPGAAVRLSRRESAVYRRFRQQLGRAILLGLELLVAGDIVRTVAASPSLTSVAILAAIVLIRTFLSFSLEVETTGRWPWQKRDISAS